MAESEAGGQRTGNIGRRELGKSTLLHSDLSIPMPDVLTAARLVGRLGVDPFGVPGIISAPAALGAPSPAALAGALRPLAEAIGTAPAEARQAAEAKLAALSNEAAKGKDADDSVIADLVDGLVELVPLAAGAVAAAFGKPVLAALAGPVTRFVLARLPGRQPA
jgi:predicted short-subunit dehydrogenase-like oxidoreductase (DUF2520 family)